METDLEKSSNWKKNLVSWLAVLSSLSTIAALISAFLPNDKKINIDVITKNVESLTDHAQEPELKISYQFKGEKINNLWKYTILMTNSSNTPIIGLGFQKNILTDTLNLFTKKGYELIDKRLIYSNFPHNLKILDSNKIGIAFQQWRPNEKIIYSFYIKHHANTNSKKPFSLKGTRPIINGDFIFSVDNIEGPPEKITDSIPKGWKKIVYVMFLIILGFLLIFIMTSIVDAPLLYFRSRYWFRNNRLDYENYIQETFKSNAFNKRRYMESPINLPEKYWEHFKGNRYPLSLYEMDIKKFRYLLLVISILIVFGFSISIVFIDLIYYFP